MQIWIICQYSKYPRHAAHWLTLTSKIKLQTWIHYERPFTYSCSFACRPINNTDLAGTHTHIGGVSLMQRTVWGYSEETWAQEEKGALAESSVSMSCVQEWLPERGRGGYQHLHPHLHPLLPPPQGYRLPRTLLPVQVYRQELACFEERPKAPIFYGHVDAFKPLENLKIDEKHKKPPNFFFTSVRKLWALN